MDLLLVAAWFGTLAGLAEGILRVVLRSVPGFVDSIPTSILWTAPAFDVVLFVALAIAFGMLCLLVRRPPRLAVLAGLLTAVGFLGLLLALDRLNQVAMVALSLGVGIQTGRVLNGLGDAGLRRFVARSWLIVGPVALVLGLTSANWESWSEARAIAALPPAPIAAPNVLLITLDTVRADHLSGYGYPRQTTPNLDRLANGGVLFEAAMANASWTLPSHASLLTGLLPNEHGAEWSTPLGTQFPMLPEALAARGYITAAFAANTIYVSPEWGLGRGFARFDVYNDSLADDATRPILGRKAARNLLPLVGYWDVPGRKSAERIDDQFLDWLDRAGDRPFFALLNFFDDHDPYLAEDPYRTAFGPEATRGDLINYQFRPQAFRLKPTLSEHEIQLEVDSYDGALAYLDAQVGRLFAELDRRGLARNTLVVVTSDHGESLGAKDLFGHGNSLYLETLHVPLIISWPGVVPGGIRVPRVVGLQELPATVQDLTGGDRTAFPGRSLASLWAGPAEAAAWPDEPVLAYVTGGRFKGAMPNYPASQGDLSSLTTDDWHFILNGSGRTELYAWRADPGEERDLADSPTNRAVVDQLRAQLLQMLAPHR